jgi:hypothetical protein
VVEDLPDLFWPKKCHKSHAALFECIATLPPDLQDRIIALARLRCQTEAQEIAYANSLFIRHQKHVLTDDHESARMKCRRIQCSSYDDSMFMSPVSDEDQYRCLQSFIHQTSNHCLQQAICMVCAGRFERCNMTYRRADDIPNQHKLYPMDPHPSVILIQGMLLHKSAVSYSDGCESGYICEQCWRGLVDHRKFPRFALANNLWIGEIPFELQVLTMAEKLLISLYYPSAYIIKLFPKETRTKHWNSSSFNQGVRGNVSTYRLCMEDITDLTSGQVLPRHSDILASVVSVCVLGPKGFPDMALRELLQVRRSRMKDAILWLKRNNPLYFNIGINEDNLLSLPQDDVPDTILENVRYNDSDIAFQREQQSVVPEMDIDDDGEANNSEDDICVYVFLSYRHI